MKVLSNLKTFALLAIVLMAYGFAGQMDYEDEMKMACALRDWPLTIDEAWDTDPCACLLPDDSPNLHFDSQWSDRHEPSSCASDPTFDGEHHATDTSPQPSL
ncbi:hypothetical protein [Aquabacterium sp.]|uniref:hypothetical protein n=1 Tax=Aquabacterium sp. TaxID=1872578 RepID=UPI0040376061